MKNHVVNQIAAGLVLWARPGRDRARSDTVHEGGDGGLAVADAGEGG
jgi:hypothetical protein